MKKKEGRKKAHIDFYNGGTFRCFFPSTKYPPSDKKKTCLQKCASDVLVVYNLLE